MQEQLIIFLSANELDNPDWVIIRDQQLVEHSRYGDPQALQALSHGREVIVVVPAEDVLMLAVNLPKMNAARLRQAIPFALEDQLAQDVEELHFAYVQPQPDQSIAVAVVSKQKMQVWLSLLSTWQLKPDLLTSQLFALPVENEAWHIYCLPSGMIARLGAYQGFSCEHHNLQDMLQIALAEQELKPHTIAIHNYTALPCPESIAEHAILVTENTQAQALDDLALNLSQGPVFNLLQGAFALRKPKRVQLTRLWQVMIVCAGLWGLSIIFYPIVSYYMLQHKVQELNQDIAAIYHRHFPQAASVVAPKLRMQEKLQHAGHAEQNKLLLLMAYVSDALAQTQGIKLQKIDFRNQRLTLDLIANTSEALSAFMDNLNKAGLSVKQQNANLTGSTVDATLSVE